MICVFRLGRHIDRHIRVHAITLDCMQLATVERRARQIERVRKELFVAGRFHRGSVRICSRHHALVNRSLTQRFAW